MEIADLTSPRTKLGWANEHLNIFNKEFGAFFAKEPKSVVIKFRREEGWYVAYIDPLPLPPMRLVLIAGDCFNNLRATLDHLVWQLVLREGQKPRYTHHFPICETEKQFLDDVKSPQTEWKIQRSPLRGISTDSDVWTIIEDAQPFKRAEPQADLLFLLARMNNFDKHRTLLAQRVLPDEETITRCVRWNPKFKLIEKAFLFALASQEHPTKIMRFRFAPDGNPGMHVKGEFRVYPTLGDGKTQGSFDMLGAIRGHVQKILDKVATLPGVKNVPTPVYSSVKKRR